MKKIITTLLFIAVVSILMASSFSNIGRFWLTSPSSGQILKYDTVNGMLRIVNTDSLDVVNIDSLYIDYIYSLAGDTIYVKDNVKIDSNLVVIGNIEATTVESDSSKQDFIDSKDSTDIEVLSDMLFGGIESTTNAGSITAYNMPVDANSADGTEHSSKFKVGGISIFKFGGLSDGAGSADSVWIESYGKFVLDSLSADPDSVKGTVWYGGGDDSLHIWTGAGKQTFQLKMAD